MSENVGSFIDSILPAILRTIGSVLPIAKGPAELLAKAIDKDSLTTEQKAALQTAMTAHEEKLEELALERAKIDVSVIHDDDEVEKSELASGDKFVSRARPSLLYIAGGITAALAGAIIFGVKVDSGAVAEVLVPLWGHAGFYTWQRTKEKKAGVG